MKTLPSLLTSLCILAGCAPTPQYRGQLVILNDTENTITVQSNLTCPNGTYPAEITLAPGKTAEIASTATVPDGNQITIDSFLTNPTDAAVTVSVDGSSLTKTWTYAGRTADGKQLFNLKDSQLESGEDARKNFTYINYVFKICEEDLR